MRDCDDQYPWLGEFLTEYVDGTMSPAARAAFEECLRGNPDLTGFVERLRHTRQMLCGYGCDVHAPCNLREQLHARLLREGLLPEDVPQAPAPTAHASLPGSPALRATIIVLACAMGAAVFTARASLDTPAASAEMDRMVTSPAAPLTAASSVALPISARVLYGEPRVATRADSVRRARRLAEWTARALP